MECNLKLTKRKDGWWITNFPEGFDECGPYTTKDEAAEDKRGLERTLAHWEDEAYWAKIRKL
jgi:hypothetical protein